MIYVSIFFCINNLIIVRKFSCKDIELERLQDSEIAIFMVKIVIN